MPIDRYRIKSPTIALFEEDGRHVADTVPIGAIVEIDSEMFDGNKLVTVAWDGRHVMMFTQDLRSRGEAIKGRRGIKAGLPAIRPFS
jgi:hypothetical protein